MASEPVMVDARGGMHMELWGWSGIPDPDDMTPTPVAILNGNVLPGVVKVTVAPKENDPPWSVNPGRYEPVRTTHVDVTLRIRPDDYKAEWGRVTMTADPAKTHLDALRLVYADNPTVLNLLNLAERAAQ